MIRHVCNGCGKEWYCKGKEECEKEKDTPRVFGCYCIKCFPISKSAKLESCIPVEEPDWRIAWMRRKCFGDFNQALEDTDKRNCFDCPEQGACLKTHKVVYYKKNWRIA